MPTARGPHHAPPVGARTRSDGEPRPEQTAEKVGRLAFVGLHARDEEPRCALEREQWASLGADLRPMLTFDQRPDVGPLRGALRSGTCRFETYYRTPLGSFGLLSGFSPRLVVEAF